MYSMYSMCIRLEEEEDIKSNELMHQHAGTVNGILTVVYTDPINYDLLHWNNIGDSPQVPDEVQMSK